MQETQEMQVQSLGWEDPLEEEMETHSSILDQKIPWREEPGGLQSMGLQRVRHDWAKIPTNIGHIPIVHTTSDAILSVLMYQFNEFPQQSNFWKRYYWYSHFMAEETEEQRDVQDHIMSQQQSLAVSRQCPLL